MPEEAHIEDKHRSLVGLLKVMNESIRLREAELARLPQDHPAAIRCAELLEEMRTELKEAAREIAELGPEYRALIEQSAHGSGAV